MQPSAIMTHIHRNKRRTTVSTKGNIPKLRDVKTNGSNEDVKRLTTELFCNVYR